PGETFGKVFQDSVSGHKIAHRKIMSEKCAFLPNLGAGVPWDEFCPVENTKMLGVELIMERIKDEVGTTYGFGDSDNDLPLVRACDIGVAVGNATDNLKAECAFISKPLVESGCAYALEHFGLLG
ncbi:MAG: HAD hydrolase family protein, partial [Atopobiaceae bacterium]|nr:HAD hydrolase family protein [Atopobiaceae bacterium]